MLIGPPMTADEVEVEDRAEHDKVVAAMDPVRRVQYCDRVPNVPFGFLNAAWEKLKARQQPGDVFQKFTNGEDAFRNMCGRSGIALVRNGKGIYVVITRMN